MGIKIALFLTSHHVFLALKKMILALVSNASRAEGRDIRPRSLQFTSISALVSGIVKGNANPPPPISGQGKLSRPNGSGIGEICSRNKTQQLSVSKFALGAMMRARMSLAPKVSRGI